MATKRPAPAPRPAAPKTPAPPPPPRPVEAKSTRPFKVAATQMGFFEHKRRRPGDVFSTTAAHFNPHWMERVDPATPDSITTGKQALRDEHDAVLATKLQPGMTVDVDTPTGAEKLLGDD